MCILRKLIGNNDLKYSEEEVIIHENFQTTDTL